MPIKKDGEPEFKPTFSDENKPKDCIYWARPAGLSIANFVKEVREGNAIVQPEASLQFVNHIKITSDPKEIEFIENSQSFKNGKVQKVDSLEKAYALTAQVRTTMQIREITSTSDESHVTIGRR